MSARRTAVSLIFLAAAALVASDAPANAGRRKSPVNVAPPAVSGSPVQGQVLTASTGSWSGNPAGYAYAWQRCDNLGTACVAVAGATSATRLLDGGDVGHTLRVSVTASNRWGSDTARSAATAVVTAPVAAPDTTPPTAPGTPQLTAATGSSLSMSWSASTDAVGVAGYDVYRGSTKAGSTTGTAYTVSGLTCGTSYALGVVAFDAAGNRSPQSTLSASTAACPPPPPPPSPPAAGLHVSGNKLLDASGNTVHLHGVNRAGTEYACVQGWGIFDGPTDAASVQAIRSWNVNVVHLGLNEDCVLGINGVPAAYSGANYLNAVVSYVNLLHQNGVYAEVSLMWAAPGTQKAQGHPPILNQDHSAEALKAIANAFKNDPNTFIGLQSEPHDISWACYRDGGSWCSVGYAALGMQAALNAVRSTGATNVVTMSGIDWANNLTQWLAYKPSDPANQLMAEQHVYGKNVCSTVSCLDSQTGPVAAQVPVVFGETGETYDDSSCGSTNVSAFMSWADAHGVGYEAWVWDTWGTCGSLISSYNGTPANAYGTWVRNHLLSLPA